MVKKIESSDNTFIKKLSSLKLKKYRDKEDLYLTEGLRISQDIMKDREKKEDIEKVILTEKNLSLLSDELFSSFKEKTIIISDKLEKEITDTITSQGVFLLLKKPLIKIEDRIHTYSRLLVLDNISDPGNMGTIIRSGLAAKFDGIISLKGSVDIYNPKVIRSTMGAINKIDIFHDIDPNIIFPMISKRGFQVLAGDTEGSRTIYDHFPEEKIALVMGSEAKGLGVPEEYIDFKITIPMNEESESLNVSVAAGILMYAINRSRFEK